MDDELDAEYPAWELVLEHGIPLAEMERDWSLPDIHKAAAILQMKAAYKAAYESYIYADAEKKGKK